MPEEKTCLVVAVVFTGGTIGMTGGRAGAVTRLTGAELIAAVPQLGDLDVDLHVDERPLVPSASLTFDDIAAIARDPHAARFAGVVVVQGTDTIEETSYLLDLLWPHESPIVVTGAMRNPTLAGPDGPANLLAAVTVAAAPAARGRGALVVLNDEIHAARFVRKGHTTNPSTFVSPNAGPVGVLVEGRPVFVTSTPRRPVHQATGSLSGRVPVLAVALDEAVETVTAMRGCDGVVVAAMGGGHVPGRLAEPLGDLAQRMPVVLASRAFGGSVLSSTYGAPGSETDLRARGLIGAGLLDPYKARVLLRVCLAGGYDNEQIEAAFRDAV